MRLGRRLEMVEHSVEEAVTKAREQGRETSRSLSDRIAEVEDSEALWHSLIMNFLLHVNRFYSCFIHFYTILQMLFLVFLQPNVQCRNGFCAAQSNMSSLCSAPESRESNLSCSLCWGSQRVGASGECGTRHGSWGGTDLSSADWRRSSTASRQVGANLPASQGGLHLMFRC